MNTKQLIRIFAVLFLLYTLHFTLYTSIAFCASKGNPPVAHWRFDDSGGATAYDDSANNNDGTLTPGTLGTNTAAGQMWYPQGKLGGAMELDGTDDYVDAGSASSLTFTNAVTLEAWVKYLGPPSADFTPYFYDDWVDWESGAVATYPNRISFFVRGVTTSYKNIVSYDQDGNWHHFVMTYDNTLPSGNAKAYVDGILKASVDFTETLRSGTTNFTISGYPGRRANGLIDDVRIYNYARTADQIMVDYNTGSAAYLGAGTDPNEGNPPVGWWSVNENTGTNAYDKSGNNNNGTITNATWANGKYGSALNFDGNGDYVDAGNGASVNFSSGQITVEAWVKITAHPTAASAYPGIVGNYGATASTGGYLLSLTGTNQSNKTMFFLRQDSTIFNAVSTDAALSTGTWHHVVGLRDSGNVMKIYVDGIQQASTVTYTGTFSPTTNLYVGKYGGDCPNAIIDEVKVYNYARTPGQIAYDYSKGKPIAHYKFDEGGGVIAHNEYSQAGSGAAAPVAWWRMDEASSGAANGATIVDQSGYGNSGTASYGANLTGMTWTSGKIGNGALSFDGVDDVVNCGTPSALDITGTGITYEAWIYHTFTPGSHTYANTIRKHWSGGNWIRFEQNGETPNFNLYGVGNVNANTTLSPNTWYHITGTYNGSNMKIYINGVLKNSTAATASITSSAADSFYIGAGAPGSEPWKGYIDDVRAYNYARSAEQIYNDYKNTHGTLVGDTKFVDGKLGKALNFDGTGDYVKVPDNDNLDLASGMTISAWVNGVDDNTNRVVLGKEGAYLMRLNPVGESPRFSCFVRIGGAWEPRVSTSFSDNTWTHFSCTFDGSTLRLYKNGSEVSSNARSGSIDVTTDDLFIGLQAGTSTFWNGKIDDIRIYNYSRTAGQVMQDYNAGLSAHAGVTAGEADPWGGALPIGHWRMDENTGVLARDASGNGNNGTLTNGPTWAQGKYSPALSFDGSNDYVSLPAFSNPSSVTDYSISFWFYMNAHNPAGRTYLYDFRGNGSVVDGAAPVFLIDNSGGLGTLDAFTGIELISNAISVLTQWHYVTVTRTSGTTKIYLDSLLVKEGDAGAGGNLGVAKRLGDYAAQNTPGGNYWLNGIIDDIKIYNYARTQAQIVWDYNRGKPVAHWRMDEATTGSANGTNNIKDDSGNGNQGSGNYGANLTGMSWTTGKFGGALSFDGADDKVVIGDKLDLIGSPISISAWVKPNALSAYAPIVEKLASGGNYRLIISNTSGNFAFGIRDSAGSYQEVPSNGTLQIGQWAHVAATFDNNTTGKLYLNGALDATKTNFTITRGDTSSVLEFGFNQNNAVYYNGLLDDVRVYNYVRTAEQVMQDYNQGLATKLGD